MRRYMLAAVLTLLCAVMVPAQTKILSHRGFYGHPGSFENTLTSLAGAQRLGFEAV